jgi:hypothetical protein
MSQQHSIHVALTWRTRFLLWSDSWPANGPMVTGRRRTSFRMLRAGIALADEAGADGRLHGRQDWWTETHLAQRMNLSPKTAREFMRWLEETGWLTTRPQTFTSEGTRQPHMRWLAIPQEQQLNSALPMAPSVKRLGSSGNATSEPSVKIPASSGNGHIEPLPQSVDTLIRSNGEGPDVANATDEPTDTSASIRLELNPLQREWERNRDKVPAA